MNFDWLTLYPFTKDALAQTSRMPEHRQKSFALELALILADPNCRIHGLVGYKQFEVDSDSSLEIWVLPTFVCIIRIKSESEAIAHVIDLTSVPESKTSFSTFDRNHLFN
jgi:hypothetical protein